MEKFIFCSSNEIDYIGLGKILGRHSFPTKLFANPDFVLNILIVDIKRCFFYLLCDSFYWVNDV